MKTITKYITSLLMLFSMLWLSGCEDYARILAPDVSQQGNGDVILSLNVSINNSKGGTRSFETAENSLEKIHSLRVIIVNAKDTVEHNVRVDMPEGIGVDEIGELEFKVSTKYGIITDDIIQTEKKRIYLIANEDAIPSGNNVPTGMVDIRKFLEEDLKPGAIFFQSTAKYIVIWNNWLETSENAPTLPERATPFIDNEGEDKKYVLMSEFFDVNVTSNLTIAGEQKTEANLFITRNLVKFRFSIKADEDLPPFQVKKIIFSNVMQKEYLFPNETVYDPPKYDEDGKVTIENRVIESYTTPSFLHGDGNYVRPYIFEPDNFGCNNAASTKDTYEPNLYFCETRNLDGNGNQISFFSVSIEVEYPDMEELDENGEPVKDSSGAVQHVTATYGPVELPNLSSLPRNTIVQVDMTLDKIKDLSAVVTLVPYIGVDLEPDFGFDDLKPKTEENTEEDNEEGE